MTTPRRAPRNGPQEPTPPLYRVVRELEHHALRGQQSPLLRNKIIGRLREDAVEVRLRQRVQLHPDRQPALELREQVRGLGLVEGARRDEEDIIGIDVAVLGLDGRSFNQR